MTRLRLILRTINDVKEFVRIVNNYTYEIDLSSGRYVVDAKSIMGIFSLDLTKPLDVEVQSDHCADLQADLARFLV
ncbi:MAG: HPr family phosphocarrier protein [Clostridia bacterium]|nr:HPr family phosphocarrier protein [Clostridia bacterium]